MTENYIIYSSDKISARSQIFKLAQEKNTTINRTKPLIEHRNINHAIAEVRPNIPKICVEPICIDGINCEWVKKEDNINANKIILYIHGGSWCFGDLTISRHLAMFLAEMSEYKILVVDYSLAPENPYPKGLGDCEKIYNYLINTNNPENIVLLGDSAGGNLSLCLLAKIKDNNLPMPACVALASPVTDLTQNSELVRQMPDLCYTVYKEKEQTIFDLYLNGASPHSPFVSPIKADMRTYPPILIHVGEDEALCTDNINFVKEANKQGVNAVCKVWLEMFHDFTTVGNTLPESKNSLREIIEFFDKYSN